MGVGGWGRRELGELDNYQLSTPFPTQHTASQKLKQQHFPLSTQHSALLTPLSTLLESYLRFRVLALPFFLPRFFLLFCSACWARMSASRLSRLSISGSLNSTPAKNQ
uniref:Uncharacterized protein n=1 Tax=Desertifilum tharense IPPAS B-1220 TaxID=1781255 RepID=A0ACD5GNL9_9CYAN